MCQMCSVREIFTYYKDASLKDYNTFRLNSKTDKLYIVYSVSTLYSVCYKCFTQNIKYKVIGMGANLVFSDEKFNGAIIVNRTSELSFDADSVIAESGVNLTNSIQKCFMRSLGGFERLAGIPATVGGAITNNVGAFNTTFSEHVEWVQGFMKNDPTKKFKLTHDECKFGYRDSIFKSGEFIITHAKINLHTLSPKLIKANINKAINKKRDSQPLELPSAGSVFKRIDLKNEIEKETCDELANKNLSNLSDKQLFIPAKVIDELGLKGLTVGGAQISTKHAGFIVNTGNATSSDIKKLISIIKEKVKSATGVDLIEEIEFVDN